MKLVYFAWVRERIGKDSEIIERPAEVATVSDLLTWLAGRGEGYANALTHPDVIRVAIDQAAPRHAVPLPPRACAPSPRGPTPRADAHGPRLALDSTPHPRRPPQPAGGPAAPCLHMGAGSRQHPDTVSPNRSRRRGRL